MWLSVFTTEVWTCMYTMQKWKTAIFYSVMKQPIICSWKLLGIFLSYKQTVRHELRAWKQCFSYITIYCGHPGLLNMYILGPIHTFGVWISSHQNYYLKNFLVILKNCFLMWCIKVISKLQSHISNITIKAHRQW